MTLAKPLVPDLSSVSLMRKPMGAESKLELRKASVRSILRERFGVRAHLSFSDEHTHSTSVGRASCSWARLLVAGDG